MVKLDTTTNFSLAKQREVELFGSLFWPYTKQATRSFEEKGISFNYKEVPFILVGNYL